MVAESSSEPELPESGSAELQKEVQQVGCWLTFEDECGDTRSRDLDLSFLLEPLCSADGGGPDDGDEGIASVKSSSHMSSGSGATIG